MSIKPMGSKSFHWEEDMGTPQRPESIKLWEQTSKPAPFGWKSQTGPKGETQGESPPASVVAGSLDMFLQRIPGTSRYFGVQRSYLAMPQPGLDASSCFAPG